MIGLGVTSALAPLSASMLLVALPDLRRSLTLGATEAGILVSAYLAAMAFLQPVGGRIGDAFGRRRTLLTGIALFAGASALGAVGSNYGLLVAARLMQAIAGGLAFPNAFAVLRNGVSAARRGRILGALGAAMVVTSALAIPLGVLAVSLGGWRATFLLTAIASAFAFLMVRRELPHVRVAHAIPADAERQHTALLLRSPRQTHAVGAAVFSLGAINSAMYAFLVGIAVTSGSGSDRWSWLLFAFLAASTIGALAGGHLADRLGRHRTAAWGLGALVMGLIPMLAPAATAGWMHTGGSILAGFGVGVAMTGLQTVAADATSTARSGSTAGALAAARYIGAAVGAGLASVAASRTIAGLDGAMLLALASTLTALAAALLYEPSLARAVRSWKTVWSEKRPSAA
jgi:predicted MFS family arabinose efflux permease